MGTVMRAHNATFRLVSAPLVLVCLASGCPEYKLVGDESPTQAGEAEDTDEPEDTAPPDEDTGEQPPPTEECDGEDNDGDGLIDEDFPDTDGDGTADCVDDEECDGVDNDGDGDVDEEFPDTDEDGTPDCLDEEDCDGLDNDGDGDVDEGFPDTDEDGILDCDEVDYEVVWDLTADDIWEGWVDGIYLDSQAGWNQVDSYTMTLDSGTHVLGVNGWDTGLAIAGYMAQVTVDGVAVSLTGDGSWRYTDSTPATGWDLAGFDDSTWGIPFACSDTSPWGTDPADLLATGAIWVWYDAAGDCRNALDNAWFRYELTLP